MQRNCRQSIRKDFHILLGRTGQLKTFDQNGNATTPVINAMNAYGVALDGPDRIHLLVSTSVVPGTVRTFTADGKMVAPNVVTDLKVVSGVAADRLGKIYVVSEGSQIVKSYDSNGQQTEPTITKGLQTPRAIAIGPDGKIYIGNFVNVTTYLRDGQQTQPTFSAATPGYSRLNSPAGVAVDAKGNVYVGYYSAQPSHGGVAIFNPDGKVIKQFPVENMVKGIAIQ